MKLQRWMRRVLVGAVVVAGFVTASDYRAAVVRAQAVPKPHLACCGLMTAEGYKLAALLDSMHVEQLWQAHRHVNWETGEADRPVDYEGPGKATHCSAFAAAVAKRLNVYMLRPPDHSQIFLASAQAEWFHSKKGVNDGWQALEGENRQHDAVELANKGYLVTIVYESPDEHKPGHIVIVRPSEKSAEELAAEGPQIAQAGTLNHSSSIAAKSFTSHPGAWPNGVKYYAHAVDWASLSPKPATPAPDTAPTGN